jgi:hypothetical protein
MPLHVDVLTLISQLISEFPDLRIKAFDYPAILFVLVCHSTDLPNDYALID